MKLKNKLIVGVVVLAILGIYLNSKQDNMVVAWLEPGIDNISKSNPSWIFGQYSSGKIAHARQCTAFAFGWESVLALWPVSLALAIASISFGGIAGFAFRGNNNAEIYKQNLFKQEQRFKNQIEAAEAKYSQAEAMEYNSKQRFNSAVQKEKQAVRQLETMTKRIQDVEQETAEKVETIDKKYNHLQEDYKKRGQVNEKIKAENTELKLENTNLKKKMLVVAEENLSLTEKNQAIKNQ